MVTKVEEATRAFLRQLILTSVVITAMLCFVLIIYGLSVINGVPGK